MLLLILFVYFAIGSANILTYETFGVPESLKFTKINGEKSLLILTRNDLISCVSYESSKILWQKEFFGIYLSTFSHEKTVVIENVNKISKLSIINNDLGNIIFSQHFDEKFNKIFLKGQFLYLFTLKNIIFFDLTTFQQNTCDFDLNSTIGYAFDENILKFYTVLDRKLYSLTCAETFFKNQAEINIDIVDDITIDEYGVIFSNNSKNICNIGYTLSNLLTSFNYACAELKTYKAHQKLIVIPYLSKIIDKVVVIDKILNIMSIVNLSKPISDFNPLEVEDSLMFSHRNIDLMISSFLLSKNELSINNIIKIPPFSLSVLKMFPLMIGEEFSIFILLEDGFLYHSIGGGFEKFMDISMSEISAYKLITSFDESPDTSSKIDSFFEIYSSIDSIFSKFIFRIKFTLGLLYDFLNQFQHEYILDLFYRLKDGSLSVIKKSGEYHASIVSISNGIFQRVHSQHFSIFWRKFVPRFKDLNDIKILELNFKQKYKCLVSYGNSESFLYIYTFDPLTGNDCLNIILRDFKLSNAEIVESFIKVPWIKGASLNVFDENLFIIQGNTSRVLISPKINHCEKMYYFSIDSSGQNSMVYGFTNTCDGSFLDFVNIWAVRIHENSSNIKLNNDEKLYMVIKDNRVVVERSRLHTQYHQGNLVLTYIYNINMTSFFHLKYINVLTGTVLFDLTRRSCSGPVFVELYQHYIFIIYSNKYSINELLVVEIMKNSTDSELIFKTQNYILDIPPVSSMTVTKTRLGLKFPTLLLGSQGHVYALPSSLISARRSLIPSKEELEDGLLVYKPIIVPSEMMRLNKNNTLFNIKSIGVSPAFAESSTYFCAFSTSAIYCDLFRGIMEDGFDNLSSRFDPQSMLVMQLILTISTFGIIFYYYRTQRKDLWE